MEDALHKLGFSYLVEYPIGRYSVDFALPLMFVVIEVDGRYWHRDKTRDLRKERFLRKYGWHVIRFHEDEITTVGNLPRFVNARIYAQ